MDGLRAVAGRAGPAHFVRGARRGLFAGSAFDLAQQVAGQSVFHRRVPPAAWRFSSSRKESKRLAVATRHRQDLRRDIAVRASLQGAGRAVCGEQAANHVVDLRERLVDPTCQRQRASLRLQRVRQRFFGLLGRQQPDGVLRALQRARRVAELDIDVGQEARAAGRVRRSWPPWRARRATGRAPRRNVRGRSRSPHMVRSSASRSALRSRRFLAIDSARCTAAPASIRCPALRATVARCSSCIAVFSVLARQRQIPCRRRCAGCRPVRLHHRRRKKRAGSGYCPRRRGPWHTRCLAIAGVARPVGQGADTCRSSLGLQQGRGQESPRLVQRRIIRGACLSSTAIDCSSTGTASSVAPAA